MSLSDCEQCWDTPCTCGYNYRNWSIEDIANQIDMLQRLLYNKRNETRVNGEPNDISKYE